jgi:hypothetical protein
LPKNCSQKEKKNLLTAGVFSLFCLNYTMSRYYHHSIKCHQSHYETDAKPTGLNSLLSLAMILCTGSSNENIKNKNMFLATFDDDNL